MKRLYTIAAAATLATTSVFAAMPTTKSTAISRGSEFKSHHNVALAPLKAPAKASALTIKDLEGDYAWSFLDLFEGQYANFTCTFTASATEANTIVVDNYLNDDEFTIKATFDPATQSLTFATRQYLYHNTDYNADVYFATGTLPIDATSMASFNYTESITAYYDEEDGGFYFGEEDVIVLDDYLGEGYYGVYADNTILPPVTALPNPTGWKSAGKATFTDGWLFPGMTNAPASAKTWTVDLEQDPANAARYRLVDPYKNSTFYSQSNVSTPGSIIIDASNPDCVVVEPYYLSGFGTAANGEFSCYNVIGYLVDAGYSTSVILQALPQLEAQLGMTIGSTLKDRTITINGCIFGTTIIGLDAAQGWKDATMVSTIELPDPAGIDGVMVEDSEAPVKYFNLQGVEVENPEAGVVIRVQGGKASKVFVR